MNYWVWLKDKQGEPYIFQDSFLPGLYAVEKVAVEAIKDSEFCRSCVGSICHVIESGSGRKFCPILFNRMVRPSWRLDEVVGYDEPGCFGLQFSEGGEHAAL